MILLLFIAVAGCGAAPVQAADAGSSDASPTRPDVRVIVDDGSRVDLEQNLVPGSITVFDFFATWCEPCKRVDAWIMAELDARGDFAVRRIDVVDWDSPVASQHLEGRIPELPYVVVYSASGERVGEMYGGRISKLRRALAAARSRRRVDSAQ